MPFEATSDGDIEWELYHEDCHLNLAGEYFISSNLMAENEVSPDETRRKIQDFIDSDEIEEVRCYSRQLRDWKRFAPNPALYNAILKYYSMLYQKLWDSPGLEGDVFRDVARDFINPAALEYR